jgi:alkylation response protein AidB-like acyl-CoA dehydrogenase
VSTESPFLTGERVALREAARRFATEEVLPLANRLDPRQADIPAPMLRRLGELGYFGITIPEAYGGMARGVFEYVLVTEELARAWMSVASIIARGQGMGTQVADPERGHVGDPVQDHFRPAAEERRVNDRVGPKTTILKGAFEIGRRIVPDRLPRRDP